MILNIYHSEACTTTYYAIIEKSHWFLILFETMWIGNIFLQWLGRVKNFLIYWRSIITPPDILKKYIYILRRITAPQGKEVESKKYVIYFWFNQISSNLLSFFISSKIYKVFTTIIMEMISELKNLFSKITCCTHKFMQDNMKWLKDNQRNFIN